MSRTFKAIFGLLFISGILSCRNDFDLTADHQSRMVVYGLLDPADTVQYIKVERTFLGDANAYDMAAEFDSINYAGALTVTLERMSGSNVVQVITLTLDSVLEREPGTFSYPKQYLYKANQPILQDGSEYRLRIINPQDQQEVLARTPIVQQPVLQKPQGSTVGFADPNSLFAVKWLTPVEGKRFETFIRFRWDELLIMDTTQVKHKHFDWKIGSAASIRADGGELLQHMLGTDDLYNVVADRLDPDFSVHRRVTSIDIVMYIAGDDLNTYMEVAEANQNNYQEDMQYSNIEGGLGLFSSRYTFISAGRKLNQRSLDSLMHGQFTGDLGFIP